jgi:hypothetical protein
MTPRIDIEDTFDSIIPTCGGKRVRDLVGASPSFDNADYVFREHKIVAELKCLEVDKSRDPATARKLSRLWINWRQRGLVTGKTPPHIYSDQLPDTCQQEMFMALGKPIRRAIEKANRQIRETKAALGLTDYAGLLFIANDGNFLFRPPALIHYVQSVLRSGFFREIRNFVLFTVNMYSTMKGFAEPGLFWIHFTHQGIFKPLRMHRVKVRTRRCEHNTILPKALLLEVVLDSITNAVSLTNVECWQIVFLNESPKKINTWPLKTVF